MPFRAGDRHALLTDCDSPGLPRPRMETSLPQPRQPSLPVRIATYVLAGTALLLVMLLRLLPALFAGLLVYEIVQSTAPLLGKRRTNNG